MSRVDFLLWIVLPYVALAVFVTGHIWRYRRDRYGWTARSTQLLERRLLRPGSILFHVGVLAVIGGHVLGILIPKAVTEFVQLDEHAYHLLAAVAGLTAGITMTAGFLILAVRRVGVAYVRASTQRSDLVLYPLLALAILTGMAATVYGAAVGGYDYRATVSIWFRGLFALHPHSDLMAGTPFVYQAHVVVTFLLFAAWPFTRLVHVWSVPVGYVFRRSPILYRSRTRGAPAVRRPDGARAGVSGN